MKVNVKGEGGATVPARTEKEAITKAFRKLGIATRFTKDARFMKGVTVSESFGDEDEHENCNTDECCGECDESKEQPIEEAKVDELSRKTLGNYMSKSAASVSGKDAKTQDKRVAGQSMADKKLRKADGKSSDAKVAASEEKEYTVKVTGGIMRPGSTDNVKVKAKSPDHAIKQVKKTHINRHKGEFNVEEVETNVLEDFVNEDMKTTGPGVKMMKPVKGTAGKTQKVGGKLSHPPRKPNRLKPDPSLVKSGAIKPDPNMPGREKIREEDVDEDSAADVLKRRYASNRPEDNPQATKRVADAKPGVKTDKLHPHMSFTSKGTYSKKGKMAALKKQHARRPAQYGITREETVEEGAMKRMATQDDERARLGPKKVKGSGMDTFKPKPKSENMHKEPVGVSVTMVHKDSGRKQTTKFPGTHSAVAGAKSHIAQMQKKGFKVHSKNLMYGKDEAAEMDKKVKGKKGEEDVMINPTVKEVTEARRGMFDKKGMGGNLPKYMRVPKKEIMKYIGHTKNADQAIGILKKKYRVSDRDARKMLDSVFMESNEMGTAELTRKYAEATPGQEPGIAAQAQSVSKPEVAPTAKQIDQMDETEELTTYQKSLKDIMSRLKEIK